MHDKSFNIIDPDSLQLVEGYFFHPNAQVVAGISRKYNSVAVERQKHLPLDAALASEVIALKNSRCFVNR